MRKDWKYLLYIGLAFGLFLLIKLMSPKQYNWNVTYAADDKNPYGGYAFDQLIRTSFAKDRIRHSFKTLYELKDSIKASDNIIIICNSLSCGNEDTDALLTHVAAGGNAFISANNFYGKLSDTLKLEAYDNLFTWGVLAGSKDSVQVKFQNVSFDTTRTYSFRRDNVHNYFSKFDTTRTTVIAKNERQEPVTIRVRWGKGNLILNSTPMMVTNFLLLSGSNNEFVSLNLSSLPPDSFYWTEYYQRGRMEIETPLRFILQSEPLSWAYYIALFSILVFMAFEMKRRQRIIPVIEPLANTTLEFINTIGTLYYQDAHHKGIADKKINYLFDQIRTRYWVATNVLDENFIIALTGKSGKPEDEVRALVNLIIVIRSSISVSEQTLIELNDRIENFNDTAQAKK